MKISKKNSHFKLEETLKRERERGHKNICQLLSAQRRRTNSECEVSSTKLWRTNFKIKKQPSRSKTLTKWPIVLSVRHYTGLINKRQILLRFLLVSGLVSSRHCRAFWKRSFGRFWWSRTSIIPAYRSEANVQNAFGGLIIELSSSFHISSKSGQSSARIAGFTH